MKNIGVNMRGGKTALATSVLCVLIASAPLRSQTTGQKLTFELVSIKQNLDPNVPGRVDDNGDLNFLPGGRFMASRASLYYIIQSAYQLKSWEISGEPGWSHTTYYDIQAKTDKPDVNGPEMRTLLQSLLEDRFHLKSHRAPKELPVYVLAAAKSGLKLPPPKDGNCITSAPGPNTLRNGLFSCGRAVGSGSPESGSEINGGTVSMAGLITTLTNVLGRTVVDNTGFTGVFDLHLIYAFRLPGDHPETTEATSTLPTIFTALEEQLGLKLESAKRPVDVLVIDHVEQPTVK